MEKMTRDRLIIAKAKERCRQWMPYLRRLFLPMRCIAKDNIPTAAVDKYCRMYYNPGFVSKLTVPQMAYVILHEVLHVVLSHHKRTARMAPNADKQTLFLANIAQDLCIQQALQSDVGCHEPEDIVRIDQWTHIDGIEPGMTSEQYFYALREWYENREDGEPTEGEDESPSEDSEEGLGSPQDSESDGDSENDSDGDEDSDGDGESSADDGDEESDEDGSDGGQSSEDDDSDSDAESEATGSGQGESDSQSEVDTSGMPAMGDICNPAHAGSNSDGEEKPWEDPPTLADVANQERALREVEKDIDECQSLGAGGGGIRQSLKARLHPLPDPFDELRTAVGRTLVAAAGDPRKTYRKYPRRTLPGDGRLMGTEHIQPEAVILLDTSGSMESSAIKDRALTIVAKGISRLQNPRIVCCDGVVQSENRVANMSRFTWDGGGGTDMTAGLLYVQEKYNPDAIVIITDGITHWPTEKLRAKVICALCCGAWAERVPKWLKTVHLYREQHKYAL